MIWIILALGVALFKALWELAGKIFTDTKKDNAIDEYSLVFWARFFSFIILLPITFFIDIPDISLSFFVILSISSLLWAIANITAIKAVKYGELSIVWPLTALTIPFLIFTTYIINNETLNLYGYIWVLAIFIGTYFLWVSKMQKWFFAPIVSIYENTGAKYMVFTTILWSITAPLDKLWIENTGVLWWMFLTNLCITFFIASYMICIKKNFSLEKITNKKSIKKSLSITVLGWVWIFLQMLAYTYTLVIYVIAIKRASWIFSVLFWYIFYKEKNITIKLIAAAIMLAWVAIISIFGNI